jgi:Ni2+-binding GTPase involved in maturation of urease and hydrogenase
VLPVVGPGGIGKTTFIQPIYEQLKSRFQVPIWVCVSLDFNANRLAKDIVKKYPKLITKTQIGVKKTLSSKESKGRGFYLF